ncbi:MAG: GrpB family protein [Armatimonadetes bacterium]|nr:GrpB family protein [Armatimonadota bacterium]
MSDAIEIAEYNPHWPDQFAALAEPVRRALGDGLVVSVGHVGSTAVPGLTAKPIIDLDVVIPSEADLPAAIAGLAALGYVHEGDLGIPGREAFHWPPGTPRHHLYVCPQGSAELRRHVAFRDYLRTHPETAAEYAVLKRALAARFQTDRDAYSRGKAGFVAAVLEKAQNAG